MFDIFESREGDVWVGMYRCLAQFPGGRAPVRVWTKDNGCPATGALALGQDRDGNLWLGTDDLGAFKLAAGGILTYSTEDGIGMDSRDLGRRDARGELYIAGRTDSAGFRRRGFARAIVFMQSRPAFPRKSTYFGWRPRTKSFYRITPANGGWRLIRGYAGIPV